MSTGATLAIYIIVIIVALAVHIGLTIWGSKIGITKGYSGAVGGLLVFFFGLIGLLIILVMGPAVPTAQNPQVIEPTKKEEPTTKEKLAKLDRLLDEKVILKEEYDKLRAEVLSKAAK